MQYNNRYNIYLGSRTVRGPCGPKLLTRHYRLKILLYNLLEGVVHPGSTSSRHGPKVDGFEGGRFWVQPGWQVVLLKDAAGSEEACNPTHCRVPVFVQRGLGP